MHAAFLSPYGQYIHPPNLGEQLQRHDLMTNNQAPIIYRQQAAQQWSYPYQAGLKTPYAHLPELRAASAFYAMHLTALNSQ